LPILFRSHHFLCIFNFQGLGYSAQFAANICRIIGRLSTATNNKITIVNGCDSICKHCPHCGINNFCVHAVKVAVLDAAYSKILKLKPGDQITWNEAKQRIITNLSQAKFTAIC